MIWKYKLKEFSDAEREFWETVLREEIEMQSWSAVRCVGGMGELILFVQ
ncbi:MAG TPA: hypothetical protein VGB89_12165 [Bacteroidota bacterium]